MIIDTLGLDSTRYSNAKYIGRGASGKVYSIYDSKMKETIALKVVDINPSNEKYERESIEFERETKLMAEVAHPTIVRLISYMRPNIVDNKPASAVIFTEFMKNGSLEAYLNKAREDPDKYEWDNTKKMISLFGIAVGMKHIHQKGVIHRDLKTGNVLLDDNLYPRITDFGLSKITKIQETQSVFGGTVQYMAPEVMSEDSYYSFPVDVYAYSMIIYEVITGLPPYGNLNYFQIFYKVMNSARPPIPNDFPEAYKNLMIRCWDQDPQNRPTFNDIVDELQKPEYVLPGTDLEKVKEYSKFISKDVVVTRNTESIMDLRSTLLVSEESETIQKIESIRRLAYSDSDSPERIQALLDYGNMLQKGIMIPLNLKEAANCYKIAADKGNSLAQYRYGHMLENGEGIEKDIKTAAKYYKLSSDGGCLDGINAYAVLLISGSGCEKNVDEGIKLLKQGIEKKNAMSIYNYGILLFSGMVASKDANEAQTYFKMAVDLGYIPALVYYGKMLKNDPSKINEAIECFSKADECNDSTAQYELGLIYSSQNELEKAADYFKKSAHNGNANAMLKYYECCLNGKGVPVNKALAAEYLKKAADKGNNQAIYLYGNSLISGDIVNQNIEEGIKLLESIIPKIQEAAKLLGFMFYDGKIVQKDLKKAAQYLEKISQPDIDVIQRLQFIYYNQPEKAYQYYYLGYQKKDIQSTALLGDALLRGHGVAKDEKRGMKLLLACVGQNNVIACLKLGEYYEKQKNVKKALSCYNRIPNNPMAKERIQHLSRSSSKLSIRK